MEGGVIGVTAPGANVAGAGTATFSHLQLLRPPEVTTSALHTTVCSAASLHCWEKKLCSKPWAMVFLIVGFNTIIQVRDVKHAARGLNLAAIPFHLLCWASSSLPELGGGARGRACRNSMSIGPDGHECQQSRGAWRGGREI